MITEKVITIILNFLFGRLVIGIIFVLPLLLGIPDIWGGETGGWYVTIISLLNWVFGLLLLRNLFICVFGIQDDGYDLVE
jgi:hypothetical protein